MEESSEEFNFTQWLSDALEMNLNSDEIFGKFASNIFENIDQFARLPKDAIIDNFSHLDKNAISRLRISLSSEVIDFHNLENTHTLKTTKNHTQILEDLYVIIQLSSANMDQILAGDLSKTYNVVNTNAALNVDIKDLNMLYQLLNDTLQKNHNLVVEKLKNAKFTINSQNKKINNLENQNMTLTKELGQVKIALEAVNTTLKSKKGYPPPPPFSMQSNNYASITASNTTNAVSNTPSRKRPPEQSQSKKSTTSTRLAATPNNNNRQRELMNFNSFDAQSNNVPISSNNNNNNNNNNKNNNRNTNAFIIAGEKQQQKRQRNLQNKQYNKSVGLGIGSDLLVRKRNFFVYFGNIDIKATTEAVKESLNRILNGIEFDDFIELNTDKHERKSKSFKFSIGYLDKDVINQKQLWPQYTIVNRYKMSLSEWEAVSANFNNRKSANTANSNSTANIASIIKNNQNNKFFIFKLQKYER
jgi:hypothetical protein